jgi:hypothetical protein
LLNGRRNARRCPGSAILAAYDQAADWRDIGRCVISGFHSLVEKECLRILLRGKQPVIICPARALPKRIPPEWRTPLADDRLLILSAFAETRVTAALAHRRNEIVAALADEDYFAHITPGGHSERLAAHLPKSGIRIISGGGAETELNGGRNGAKTKAGHRAARPLHARRP